MPDKYDNHYVDPTLKRLAIIFMLTFMIWLTWFTAKIVNVIKNELQKTRINQIYENCKGSR